MTQLKGISLENISYQELEAMLKEKREQERIERSRRKAEYEWERDQLVDQMVARAKTLQRQMQDFKNYCLEQFEEFRDTANEYGDIRSNSKGGFSLRSSATENLVSLDRNTVSEYDERAAMAEALLREFLEETVKKRDKQTYRVISTLLQRNKEGEYTPGRVASLLKIKDNYDDPRWLKAMELFEESYQNRMISYSVSFFKKDNMGKDVPVTLTFSRLPALYGPEQEKTEL